MLGKNKKVDGNAQEFQKTPFLKRHTISFVTRKKSKEKDNEEKNNNSKKKLNNSVPKISKYNNDEDKSLLKKTSKTKEKLEDKDLSLVRKTQSEGSYYSSLKSENYKKHKAKIQDTKNKVSPKKSYYECSSDDEPGHFLKKHESKDTGVILQKVGGAIKGGIQSLGKSLSLDDDPLKSHDFFDASDEEGGFLNSEDEDENGFMILKKNKPTTPEVYREGKNIIYKDENGKETAYPIKNGKVKIGEEVVVLKDDKPAQKQTAQTKYVHSDTEENTLTSPDVTTDEEDNSDLLGESFEE